MGARFNEASLFFLLFFNARVSVFFALFIFFVFVLFFLSREGGEVLSRYVLYVAGIDVGPPCRDSRVIEQPEACLLRPCRRGPRVGELGNCGNSTSEAGVPTPCDGFVLIAFERRVVIKRRP